MLVQNIKSNLLAKMSQSTQSKQSRLEQLANERLKHTERISIIDKTIKIMENEELINKAQKKKALKEAAVRDCKETTDKLAKQQEDYNQKIIDWQLRESRRKAKAQGVGPNDLKGRLAAAHDAQKLQDERTELRRDEIRRLESDVANKSALKVAKEKLDVISGLEMEVTRMKNELKEASEKWTEKYEKRFPRSPAEQNTPSTPDEKLLKSKLKQANKEKTELQHQYEKRIKDLESQLSQTTQLENAVSEPETHSEKNISRSTPEIIHQRVSQLEQELLKTNKKLELEKAGRLEDRMELLRKDNEMVHDQNSIETAESPKANRKVVEASPLIAAGAIIMRFQAAFKDKDNYIKFIDDHTEKYNLALSEAIVIIYCSQLLSTSFSDKYGTDQRRYIQKYGFDVKTVYELRLCPKFLQVLQWRGKLKLAVKQAIMDQEFTSLFWSTFAGNNCPIKFNSGPVGGESIELQERRKALNAYLDQNSVKLEELRTAYEKSRAAELSGERKELNVPKKWILKK